MEKQIDKYEISIWEDVADSNINASSFIERKIATIGGDSMDSPVKAFNPVLTENINGQRTLTFQIARKYRNEEGELVSNPFLGLLVAERKIKLRDGAAYDLTENGAYSAEKAKSEDTDERWKDFLIKNVTEDKLSYINTYVCQELHVTELGKNGYGVVLNTELENNYGTLKDLASKVLVGSGWKVICENPPEEKTEQLFALRMTREVTVRPSFGGPSETMPANTVLYFFYSDVEPYESKWIIKIGAKTPQVLIKKGGIFTLDDCGDNHTIVNDDYRYSYILEEDYSGVIVYPVGSPLDPSHAGAAIQGKKLVESDYSHYEPIAKKYVTDYIEKGTGEAVYGYKETEYVTTDIVKNYLANPTNFTSHVGWGPTNTLQFRTFPVLEPTDPNWNPVNYMVLPQVTQPTFYYNEGAVTQKMRLVKDNLYVIRMKLRKVNTAATKATTTSISLDTHSNTLGLSVDVCTYNRPSAPVSLIGGAIPVRFPASTSSDMSKYGFPLAGTRTPFDGTLREFKSDEEQYIYAYVKATKTTASVGEDVYFILNSNAKDTNYLWHISDIQFFDYKEYTDSKNVKKVLFLYDTPEGKAIENQFFYTVDRTSSVDRIIMKSSDPNLYTVVKRPNYEAVRHIEIGKSNYFNNISSLAELFEVWVRFRVKHDKSGNTLLDEKGEPIKEVIFSRFSPLDEYNWAGFKYEQNLNSIQRTTVSDAISTKIVVEDNENEFATNGICSIRRAIDNLSGENTIYNFDYYINMGLLDSTQMLADFYGLTDDNLAYYYKMGKINKVLLPLSDKIQATLGALKTAEENYNYCSIAIQDGGVALENAMKIYEDYRRLGLPRTEDKLIAANVVRAKILNFEVMKDKYKGQVKEYQELLFGVGQTKEAYFYKGFWSKDNPYPKGSIVHYEDKIYRATAGHTRNEELFSATGTLEAGWEHTSSINIFGLVEQQKILIDFKKALELKLYRKYYRYIQEGIWQGQQYIDDNEYYLDGYKVANQSAYPQVNYQIDVADISMTEGNSGYTFKLGQKTYIEDTDFFGWVYLKPNGEANGSVRTPFKKEVVVTSYTRNFDNPAENQIEIQTYKNQWEDLFSHITATTQSLQYASGGYNRAASVVQPNGEIKMSSLQQAFENNAFVLGNAKNQGVTWDSGDGINIVDSTNTNSRVKITSYGIMLSTDGGKTWTTGITGRGINTSHLLAGQLDVSKINLIGGSANPAFTWDTHGISAYLPDAETAGLGDNGQVYVRYNNLGLYGTLQGAAIDRALYNLGENATIEQKIKAINPYTSFMLTWNGLTIRNQGGATSLTPKGGLEVFNPDWHFEKLFIDNYLYNLDPDAKRYKGYLTPDKKAEGDLIPVVSVGKFYDGDPNTAYYGLRLRNERGEVTVTTDNQGNLKLLNQLQVGSKTPVTIGGKKIYRYAGINGLDNGNAVESISFYAGYAPTKDSTKPADYEPAPFKVYNSGRLVATQAEVTGTIKALEGAFLGKITVGANGEAGIDGSSNAPYAFWSGGATNPSFYVTPSGSMYGQDVRITGNSRIEGEIIAKSGRIERLNLDSNSYIGSPNTTSPFELFLNINNRAYGVNTLGEYFGQLAAISKNPLWTSDRGEYESPSQYNIVIGKRDGKSEIFAIYNPTTVSQSQAVFSVDLKGTVHIAGNLHAKDNLLLSGKIISNNMVIDGDKGDIHVGNSWSINSDGTANFNNVNIRGHLKAVNFGYDYLSAVGGELVISPTIVLEKEITAGNHTVNGQSLYGVVLTDWQDEVGKPASHGHGLWNRVDKCVINLEKNSQEIEGSVIHAPDLEENTFFLELPTTVQSMPKGTFIISKSENINTLSLRSKSPYGPNIVMRGPSVPSQNNQDVVIGYLDPALMNSTIISYFGDELKARKSYGLVADNAFLTGKLYMPSAGITNEVGTNNHIDTMVWEEASEIAEQDDRNVRFWAGATPEKRQSAPLIITQGGELYAQKGVFKGQIIAKDSTFSGSLIASGVTLGYEGDTNPLDDPHRHFYFRWDENLHQQATDDGDDIIPKNYIADINREGLHLWRGFNIFSKTLGGKYQGTQSNIYYPEINDPFPAVTYIDTDSRMVAVGLQALSVSDNNSVQSISIRQNSISFAEYQKEGNFTVIADAHKDNQLGNISLANSNLQIKTANKLVVSGNGNNEVGLEVNPQGEREVKAGNLTRITIGGSLAIGEKIVIKQLADGIAYNYIGD
jgi:hypothetical protein